MLLLEPNEIYFEDFSVNLLNNNNLDDNKNNNAKNMNRPKEDKDENQMISGRLKMCSKSIVFDPKDIQLPIIKISYKDCDKIYSWPGKLTGSETNVLAIK